MLSFWAVLVAIIAVFLAALAFAWLERYWNTHDDWFATITGRLCAAPLLIAALAVLVAISFVMAWMIVQAANTLR